MNPLQEVEVGRGERATTDLVAVEAPVALAFNGISHAVMMATPADLEAFALGFAVTEGLLLSREECYGIEREDGPDGIVMQLAVAAAAEARLKERRRSLAGRTGCGLCGVDSLRALALDDLKPLPPATEISPAAIERAFAALPARQPLNAQAGSVHAAAWATHEGELLDVMEDVGRHNALDKLLGARLLRRERFDSGFVLMSSRASFELVMKCARLGVPALATISAPTSLAVDLARRSGLQLWGFCRGDHGVNYTPLPALDTSSR